MSESSLPLPELAGVILAGGRSARMGADKAGLVFEDRSFLVRSCDVLRPLTTTLVVLGETSAAVPRDASVQTDESLGLPQSGLGPGAVVRAFIARSQRPALVVAVDMPLLQTDGLRWLVRRWAGAENGCVGHAAGHPQPTAMIVTPADIATETTGAVGWDDSPSLRSLCARMRVVAWPADVVNMLQNINTPEQLTALRSSLPSATPLS
ncbi:MAG: molybdopterin-guanine dinucleotide biosynthesis protein A [Bradymonadia bacterium]